MTKMLKDYGYTIGYKDGLYTVYDSNKNVVITHIKLDECVDYTWAIIDANEAKNATN